MARSYYNPIDYLLEKFYIIFEKIIFGDSVIEKCNKTLNETDEVINDNKTKHAKSQDL